ncbi:TPA: DUF551 domain-containing protein [Escherichia coli]|uniref:DUF551 domain-containing protein n=2 Tax=Escherichia coli TaxID=562 RepID=UPI0007C5F946|nr:DUF551 domain-containing protein [Escherichia coli]MCK3175334.1 DUF551 domain-containing protein [Escherichia coli]MCM1618664.1 DUF551 domain-containing protein [Escherichia coli]MDZ9963419.1 DUF551 domain-containing protein [Escherichia coli]OAF93508.1 hypothetical protein PPECC79_24890 [Escherichia coli PCN079]
MTTMTREEQKQVLIDTANHIINRDNTSPYSENLRELARIALASLEAEPVAWMRDDADGREYNARNEFSGGGGGVPLYATPPVPVVPEEKPMPNPLSMYAVDAVAAIAEVRGWNACRAAMLHSAEPASNHEELPLDYLQGQKDGLEWAAQLAEANHPQTGDWLYDDPLELAKAIRKGPDMPEFDGPTPITPEAIENAIEYIRSIAFHIDEDDYHGKHIAYFMRQALVWLEGHSCSDDRQGKAENQPVRGNQAAESNRGNEWTGNPDIDNAIIMLDRIDTLESCDDDRIEAVKTVLRRLAGNYPVTPDGWISCSERMPENIPGSCKEYLVFDGLNNKVHHDYWVVPDGDSEPVASFWNHYGAHVTHWMPLPEPPQEAK